MSTTPIQFKKSYQELLDFICAGVPVFGDNDPLIQRERIAACKTDKILFAKTYFPHYCENEPVEMHKEMFRIASQSGIGAIVYGFRGCAKSTIISLIDVIHKIVYNAKRFIGFISASEDNAAEYTMPIKAELEANARLINDFGELMQGAKKNRDTDFITKNGVRVLGIGPKMSPKGRKNVQYRFDHFIIEDIESRTSPNSPRVIKKIVNFLLKDAFKAMVPNNYSFIFLGNYFSKKSILHKLLHHNDCRHFIKAGFPALIDDGKGNLISAWPERFPTDKLLQDLEQMPDTERVEMLQKPEDEDAYFNPDWFKRVEPSDVPANLKVVTYCDPAVGETKKQCFQALGAVGLEEIKDETGKRIDYKYYVLFSSLRREPKSAMVKRHFEISKDYDSAYDCVEAFGYQASLKDDYEQEEVRQGKRINLVMDRNYRSKETRIESLQSPILRGKIVFVIHNGLNALIDQFTDYPEGFVDGPDMIACAIDFINFKILKIKKKVTSRILGAA